MRKVYLDHSATTPLDAEVLNAMMPYYLEFYGNPSSVHHFGQEARTAIDEARYTIARLINAHEREIVFLSGGTEADNLAIKGVAYHPNRKGDHIITTKVEHNAM